MRETIHQLKTEPKHFADQKSGRKTFEVRKDDRGFSVGDVIELSEYHEQIGFTGRKFKVRVGYILRDTQFPAGIMPGYCILATSPL